MSAGSIAGDPIARVSCAALHAPGMQTPENPAGFADTLHSTHFTQALTERMLGEIFKGRDLEILLISSLNAKWQSM